MFIVRKTSQGTSIFMEFSIHITKVRGKFKPDSTTYFIAITRSYIGETPQTISAWKIGKKTILHILSMAGEGKRKFFSIGITKTDKEITDEDIETMAKEV